jgi:hypothetical protein
MSKKVMIMLLTLLFTCLAFMGLVTWGLSTNSKQTNIYFEANYWHPEQQHVVIAHRGTDPANIRKMWSDLKVVLRNHYVSQMESAINFEHKVVEALQSGSPNKGVNIPLFLLFTLQRIG